MFPNSPNEGCISFTLIVVLTIVVQEITNIQLKPVVVNIYHLSFEMTIVRTFFPNHLGEACILEQVGKWCTRKGVMTTQN